MLKTDELTEAILRACFEVSNELGAGFLESVYEKALLLTLRQRGFKADFQVPISVKFRGECVGSFFADLLVNEEIVVELKTVKSLLPEHLAQTINYLKVTGLKTALLVNFGNRKVEYKRLFNRIETLV